MRRNSRMRQVSERKLAARELAAGIWAACYDRDGGRCFKCGTVRGKLECHHRLGGGLGPDTLENRVMLHGWGNNLTDSDDEVMCHGWAHHNHDEAAAGGWVISRHDRRPPQQVPARHWGLGMVFLTASGLMVPEHLVVAWTVDGQVPLTQGDLAYLGEDGSDG
jgi:hypothetical protein